METANFLLCLVAIVISSAISSPENDGRIVNGVAIPNSDVPYIVLIEHKDRTYCGGSLVAPGYVATAGHCAVNKTVDGFTIIANITSIYETGIRRNVSKVFVHPDYEGTNSDIAILQLNKPIVNIPTIELCNKAPEAGDEMQVCGWGMLAENRPASSTLQSIHTPVRTKKDCEAKFGYKIHTFCASGLNNQSSCVGDSGGPGVIDNQLCGIVSFGTRCGLEGYLSGFTDVYKVKPFIQNITGLN